MNGRFGALGHGISDSDTGDLVESSDGALYSTEIMGIEKEIHGKTRTAVRRNLLRAPGPIWEI